MLIVRLSDIGELRVGNSNRVQLDEHIIADTATEARLEKRRLIEKVCEIADGNLAPQKKLLFLLYYRHGYKQSDIAALLGVEDAVVFRRLRRIRRELTKEKYKIKKGQYL